MPKRIVAVYAGRFQPLHLGHVAVYNNAIRKFGKSNVYISTSDKTDPSRSPLPFKTKKMLWQKQGAPANQILKVRRNYNFEEISKVLHVDPDDFAFVVLVGQKDAQRLKNGKYFLPFEKNAKNLKPASENGYYFINPNFKLNGTIANASALRAILSKPELSSDDYKILQTASGMDKATVDKIKPMFEHIVIRGSRETILELISTTLKHRRDLLASLAEGGNAGHMSHPFEDLSMTFAEMKKMIHAALSGKIDLETGVSEKLDGQNLFVSVIDDKVRFARNKGQIKNRGANALTVQDIAGMWKDIPHVRAGFLTAAQTLEDGLLSLSKTAKQQIFKNGRNWMNFEVLWPASRNVIDYDQEAVVLHNVTVVNDDGNNERIDSKATAKLTKMLEKAQKSVKTSMKLEPPTILKVGKSKDFSAKSKDFAKRIDAFAKSGKIKASGTVGDYVESVFSKEIDKILDKHKDIIPPSAHKGLVQRFAYGNKSYSINDWKRDIPNAPMIEDLKKLDANQHQMRKDILWPIEKIMLELGIEVLQNVEQFASANPDRTVQTLRKDIASQIKAIRGSKNINDIDKMMGVLKKVQAIGGFERLVPSEGLVFKYKGKLFKLTGLFAPINQLMGIGRFGGR